MPENRDPIPLMMLPGNIQVMLKNRIAVQGVSFMHSEEVPDGVVLMFHFGEGQGEEAEKLGMKFGKSRSGR
jgi:hypothetical protein